MSEKKEVLNTLLKFLLLGAISLLIAYILNNV